MDLQEFIRFDELQINSKMTDDFPKLNIQVENAINDKGEIAKKSKYALKRVLLWDNYFYPEQNNQIDVKYIYGSLDKHSFSQYIRNVYFNKNKSYFDIKKRLDDVLKHWPKLRYSIFEKDRIGLDECNTEQTLIKYISEQHYSEYILFAKYKLSQLCNEPFECVEEALEFDNSEILPINELRGLLCNENGISFLYSGEASKNMNLRNTINSFLKGFTKNEDKEYIQVNPVSYGLLRGIVDNTDSNANDCARYCLAYELYVHDNQIENVPDSFPVLAKPDFYYSLCSVLNSMIGRCTVHVAFLTKGTIFNSCKLLIKIK